jgi:hypothetical protein
MKKVTRLAIVLVLAFYGIVLYALAHTNVSDAYRDYYILRSNNLSIAERKRIQPIEEGRVYTFRDQAIGFDGWYMPQETQRWNIGKSAKIVFRLDSARSADAPRAVVMRIAPWGSQKTVWRLNGEQIEAREIGQETQLRLPLKNSLLRDGENFLQLDMPDARELGKGNPKLWAIAFKSMTFE